MRFLVLVGLGSALAVSAHAAPAPRSIPFLAAPGVPLTAPARAAGFCDASQRAVLWLDNGEVVAIDATARIDRLATVPRHGHSAIACDRRGTVFLLTRGRLVEIARRRPRVTKISVDISEMRVLADDSLALVDRSGAVYRWDGKRATPSWTFAGGVFRGPPELTADGTKLAFIASGRAVVYGADGTSTAGPAAMAVSWLDAQSLAVLSPTGVLARWVIGPDAPGDAIASPGIRGVSLATAGRRLIVRTVGTMRIVDQDGAIAATVSRIPDGVQLAVGDAPFGVIASTRAYVVDLTTSHDVIEPWQPHEVRAMAFSPDGRALAMLGIDDVLVARLDRAPLERRTSRQRVLPPLRWAPDGTLVARGVGSVVRWHPDGTETSSPNHGVLRGLTPDGRSIEDVNGLAIAPAGRVMRGATAAVPGEVDASASFVAVIRGIGLLQIHAVDGALVGAVPVVKWNDIRGISVAVLVGAEARAMVIGSHGELSLIDARGQRAVGQLVGRAFRAAASPDRERVAFGSELGGLTIWDSNGVRRHAVTVRGGAITALAWSPDNHTLAVATASGIELWIIPR